MVDEAAEKLESAIARHILAHMARWRPEPRHVDAAAFDLESASRRHEFVAAMEALCDAGLVMYEAVVVRNGAPCFRDAVITSSGYAALQAMQAKNPR